MPFARCRSRPVTQIKHPAASKDEEIANNTSGRIANAGLEGLAISPDGKRLYALEQLPLLQDTKPGKTGKRQGLNCRLLEIDLKTDATREFVYRLEDHHNKTSEILAVDDGNFWSSNATANGARTPPSSGSWRSTSKTRPIPAHDRQRSRTKRFRKGVRPVKKSTFIDLLDPKFGLAGEQVS